MRRDVIFRGLGMALMAALAGCGAGGNGAEVPSTSLAGSPAGDWRAAHPPGEDWNTSSDEVEAMYREDVESLRELLSVADSVPTPPRVRFVTFQEWPQAQAECLVEAGFRAHADYDSVTTVEVPDEQRQLHKEAMFKCKAMYALNPYVDSIQPRVRAEALYHHWADTLAPCLRERGLQISEPPSLDTWLERYYAVDPDLWNPSNEAFGQSSDEVERVAHDRACPDHPANFYPEAR